MNVGNVFTYNVIDFYSHLRKAFVKWRFSLKGFRWPGGLLHNCERVSVRDGPVPQTKRHPVSRSLL